MNGWLNENNNFKIFRDTQFKVAVGKLLVHYIYCVHISANFLLQILLAHTDLLKVTQREKKTIIAPKTAFKIVSLTGWTPN